MDRQGARELVKAVGDVADLKLKFTSLEKVLEAQAPSLYAAFQSELEGLRNSKAHQTLQTSLAGLQKRLESQ
jgi:hypothetical protein